MIKTDFLIVGSGIAGLVYAIKVAELKPRATITVLTKSRENDSNTRYAQGGIAAVLKEDPDSFEQHIKDTLKAGDGLCDKEIAELVVKEAPERLAELLAWGATFDMKGKSFDLAKEGGHLSARILHKGDHTGLEVQNTLLARIHTLPNIQILENYFAIDLITAPLDSYKEDQKQCLGVYALNKANESITKVSANITVLATGGIGQVYQHTTNPLIATGDGIAMAHRANAVIEGMEFIQYHPTSLYSDEKGPAFLISEAVRGLGAILRLKNGLPFMHRYDERRELASRDIVSRAINSEMKLHDDEYVYLDCTMIARENFIQHFPTIYDKCKSLKIDISKDYIPVVPAVHYLCGGIKTNRFGETSISNLYACGECANTGLHGANRLASNSLLEALVFSHRAAVNSVEKMDENKNSTGNINIDKPDYQKIKENPEEITARINILKQIMNGVGLVNSNKSLNRALTEINSLEEKIVSNSNPDIITTCAGYELRNLVTTAKLIISQSLNRKENKGVFFNEDLKNTISTKKMLRSDIYPELI